MADDAVCSRCQIPTNDLADFCSDLERIGVKYERGKTRTGWYVKAGGGCFFFEAQGKARPEDVDREVYTRPAGTVEMPPSDLDAFRAMLGRAGVRFDDATNWSTPGDMAGQVVTIALSAFAFDAQGRLLSVEADDSQDWMGEDQ